MYKLFIVDDEVSSRYGLRDCIDWIKYGIEVVGEAANGSAAMKLIPSLEPDIVITDVKMPRMDGIQLSVELKQLNKDIKIIFISGYDDFEYLKSALKVDAVDYILKPINPEEMLSVVQKVINMIDAEQGQKKLLNQMNTKLTQSMPLLRGKFFMSIIKDAAYEVNKLKERLEFLELKLDMYGRYCTLVLSIDDSAALFDNISEKDRELTSLSIISICQEIIEEHLNGYVFENKQGEYVCILNMKVDEDEDKLFILTKSIQESIIALLNIKLTIGVGKTVGELSNLSQSYKTAFEAASQKLFLGKNRIITMDSLGTYKDIIPKLDMEKCQRIYTALKTGDKLGISLLVDELFYELSLSRNIDLRYCHNVCLQLLIIGSSLLMDLEIVHDELSVDVKKHWQSVFKLETIGDMKEYVISCYSIVCSLIAEKRNKRSVNAVEKVKAIIQRKYSDNNLTIDVISQEVYLASTYLCLVFKQETGETLNEYMTKVRMEKAKELLHDKNCKLYDISCSVGYMDASYFTKIFKKYTGVTPSEYRDKYV
jgi:two-component system, response regulator YesN